MPILGEDGEVNIVIDFASQELNQTAQFTGRGISPELYPLILISIL